MPSYSTAISLLCCLALGALGLFVRENGRLDRGERQGCWRAYGLIAVVALVEWLGSLIDRSTTPAWLIVGVKCSEYALTPMACAALGAQVGARDKWPRALSWLLATNVVLQVAFAPLGLVVRVNEAGHPAHGPLYQLYVAMLIAPLLLPFAAFATYGKRWGRRGRALLVVTLVIALAGVVLQEASGAACRTTCIGLTLTAALLYVRVSESALFRVDNRADGPQVADVTDALSGLPNRRAYSMALEELDARGVLPARLAMFSVDVNGLHETNDILGHAAGDELVCGAVRCLSRVFGELGEVYRTGGDEFCVLAEMEAGQAEWALRVLRDEAARWEGARSKRLSLAAGYAFAQDNQGASAEELATRADRAMRVAKSEHYRRHRG